jgi:pimeloyl-ACP methyl ester carboxylesterase
MEHININSERFPNLHYVKTGKGPALVLIHGFPESGSIWEGVLPALAASNTVLVPDMPGSGASSVASGLDDLEQLSLTIEAILSNEQIEEAVVAGHSMGGYITMAFAESHRAWLKGIALIHSVAAADNDEKKETRRKSIEIIRKGGKETFVKQMIPNLFSSHYKQQHPEILQVQIERGLQLSADTMVAYYTAMMNRKDRRDVLMESKVPIQWILGKEDNLIPLAAGLSQSRLADINFVSIYNDCGHMSMLEQPERLAADLKLFTSYCYNR